MVELFKTGAYLINGSEIVADDKDAEAKLNKLGVSGISKEEAKKNTIAWSILEKHNTSGNMDKLKIKFDCMATIIAAITMGIPAIVIPVSFE